MRGEVSDCHITGCVVDKVQRAAVQRKVVGCVEVGFGIERQRAVIKVDVLVCNKVVEGDFAACRSFFFDFCFNKVSILVERHFSNSVCTGVIDVDCAICGGVAVNASVKDNFAKRTCVKVCRACVVHVVRHACRSVVFELNRAVISDEVKSACA